MNVGSDRREQEVSRHTFRRIARRQERRIERLLEADRSYMAGEGTNGADAAMKLRELGVPLWAKHVRYQPRYTGKRHAVVATS
jgi:hypothetical protein